MAVAITTREPIEDRSLMHYRKGGEKKGVRRYQYKDGSYTPEGYKHYAEMYGWGKKKDASGKQNNDTAPAKKPNLVERVMDHIEEQHVKNTPETRKEARETDKETEKKTEAAINSFNEKVQAQKAERAKENQSLQARIRAISKMTDDELNAGITRLQKEKQLSELINEQNAREKGPVHQFANRLFKKAVDDLSNQAMDLVVKKITNKLAMKAGLRAQDNNNRNNSNTTNTTNNSGGGNTLSKGQKSQVRSLAASGKSVAELAKQFNVSESYINQLISGSGS